MFTLNGLSMECLKNEGVRLCKKYQGNVGEIIQEMLKGSASGGTNPTSIGTSKKIDIENTTNS